MIRKANIKDIKAIYGFLQDYGKKGKLLARPLSELYDHLRDFSVYVDNNEDEERVLGCCALQFCWEDLAEIRSLAVHPAYLRKNIGSQIIDTALTEAKSFNIKKYLHLPTNQTFSKDTVLKQSPDQTCLSRYGAIVYCV